jgi:hypothetical protein
LKKKIKGGEIKKTILLLKFNLKIILNIFGWNWKKIKKLVKKPNKE